MTFEAFLASHGIEPPEPARMRGKWCDAKMDGERKSRARVKLTEDGEFGWAFKYKFGEKLEWRNGIKSKAKRDLGAENAERSERLAKQAREEALGTRRALARWNAAQPLIGADHGYLAKKRLTMRGLQGLRVDSEGGLIVPMWRDGAIVSAQRISADGEKRFATGAPSKLATYWIAREDSPVTVLTEGFATGVTLFESMPAASVLVCFSASNLIAIAERHDFTGLCVVAGDNDHRQPCPWCIKRGDHLQNPPTQPRPDECRCNPGWSAAVAAAKSIGCGWAIPPACEGVTDWNDVFCGLLAAKEKAAEGTYDNGPARLRAAALAPIGNALMKAAKVVQCKKI